MKRKTEQGIQKIADYYGMIGQQDKLLRSVQN